MGKRMLFLGLAISALFSALQANAESLSLDPPAPIVIEENGIEFSDEDAQIALFDQLHSDTSPRQQVLIGRVYIDSDAATNTLRPKRKDVVARAVQLAPDDAFVQWTAADNGSYFASSCGPTTYPEQEVGNLLRLEPENAAVWPFAVALAHAKGDQNGVDDALSRMAVLTRADDHFIERFEEWRKAYSVQPKTTVRNFYPDDGSTESAITFSAWTQINSNYSSAGSSLKKICTANSEERTWRRLGWCADIAYVLAGKGSSLELREQGLELLEAIGERGDVASALRTQYDWLSEHKANPYSFSGSGDDSSRQFLEDLRGSKTEIESIERKLKRLGKPSQAPPGWTKAQEIEPQDDPADEASEQAYDEYMEAIITNLSQSSDPHAQILAAVASVAMDMESSDIDSSQKIAELAAAYPEHIEVQWVASPDDIAAEAAITNLQRLTPENAAVWALSLNQQPADKDLDTELLQRMAALSAYDEHALSNLPVLMESMRRIPAPQKLLDDMTDTNQEMRAEALTANFSLFIMYAISSNNRVFITTMHKECGAQHAQAEARKSSCTDIGRLLLHSAKSLATAKTGEAVLRGFDALQAADLERARLLSWWSKSAQSAYAESTKDMIEDMLQTGSEVEAMQRAAQRQGHPEPPADWKSPVEKRAERKSGKAS